MIATRQVCDDSADLWALAVAGVVRFKDARRTSTRHTAHGTRRRNYTQRKWTPQLYEAWYAIQAS
jgi:hypothetical protein